MRLCPVKKKPQNRKISNIEFTLTHSIFSVNVSLRLPGLSSGFRIKKRKETILLGFADSTKMAGNSRLGRGTKPNKRYRDVQPNLQISR